MYHATKIDRRQCKRVVPMKVLVLGMSRTGTECKRSKLYSRSSIHLTLIFEAMRKALKILSYNDVYHGYAAAFENPKDCEMWLEAFRAKFDGIGKPYGREAFDKLLGHCEVGYSAMP